GQKTVTAVAGSPVTEVTLQQQARVTFIGDAAHISASRSPVSAGAAATVADGSSAAAVVVTVRDVSGNPVAGAQVSIAAP
ncbi:hypothetical protein ABTJ99_21615, partial [Acinetobacter baumannii]